MQMEAQKIRIKKRIAHILQGTSWESVPVL
jgi:hypothetical protein